MKLTILFKPKTLLGKIKLWLGLDYPGPILSEIVIEDFQLQLYEKRFRNKYVVKEEIISVLNPGKGKIRIIMNPEDFYNRWEVRFRIEPLYN